MSYYHRHGTSQNRQAELRFLEDEVNHMIRDERQDEYIQEERDFSRLCQKLAMGVLIVTVYILLVISLVEEGVMKPMTDALSWLVIIIIPGVSLCLILDGLACAGTSCAHAVAGCCETACRLV